MVRPRARVAASKKKPTVIEPETPKQLTSPSKTKTKKITVNRAGEPGYDVEVPVSEDREIQDGDMLNQQKAVMTQVPQKTGYATVGLSMGATINMGDYQSARVDAFIIRNVPDNDKAISQAYIEISRKLSEEVSRQADLLADS